MISKLPELPGLRAPLLGKLSRNVDLCFGVLFIRFRWSDIPEVESWYIYLRDKFVEIKI